MGACSSAAKIGGVGTYTSHQALTKEHKGDVVCVCVFAIRGYNDEPVETKLGMVIEGPKVEVTEGFMAASRSHSTRHVQHITARVRFNWNYEDHAHAAH